MVKREFSLDDLLKLCEKIENWKEIFALVGNMFVREQTKAYEGSSDNFSVMTTNKFSVHTYYVLYPYTFNIPSVTKVFKGDSKIIEIMGIDSEKCYEIAERKYLVKS